MRPILEVARDLGVPDSELELYGSYKAKLSLRHIRSMRSRGTGRLVLVTGITPTRHGEGKTTTTIGLSMAFARTGAQSIATLREPSLGPVFGIKGGATGGGASEVLPRTDINLHLTGDKHAVTAATNLLATLIDAHIHHGNALGIDPTRVTWRRSLDMNDRALRSIVVGLGGPGNGPPREAGFVITGASEVMAILCLSNDLADLKRRLGEIIVGYDREQRPVRAKDLRAQGAMAALLKDAVRPNLVQTTEGTAAILHGGPFGNIAHGTNSILATGAALGMADWVVTEAGFGSDLGAEKFFHIACAAGGFWPEAVVLVATCRALRHHGGGSEDSPDPKHVRGGLPNLERHIEILRHFGFTPVVALNRFSGDTPAELEVVMNRCDELGIPACESRPFQDGSRGCEALALAVQKAAVPASPRALYRPEDTLRAKIETIATKVYGASDVEYDYTALQSIEKLTRLGLAKLPVCIAKTSASISDDPKRKGAPTNWVLTVRDVTPSAGAGFHVVLAGDIMLMPGLGKSPAAERMDVDNEGNVTGL